MNGQLDFGYPWWLTYGHLVVAILFLPALIMAWVRKWNRAVVALLGAVFFWAAASAVIAHLVIRVNGRASMPTESFLRSGTGRVLDIGAGTGRSSIMVLEARPRATVVAFDLFGDSFRHHFGPGVSPQDRLMANLKTAGVEQRATIQTGDMRKLPFDAAVFDGVVSAYAIDHLNRDGSRQAIQEAARVLKPGGDFLLMVIGKDPWMQFAFGPLLLHGGPRGEEWWTGSLQQAGFQVVEHGMRPITLYMLGRKL